MTNNGDDRITVSIGEAARIAGVSPTTIRRELSDGRLLAVRMRGKPLVLFESLQKRLRVPPRSKGGR
jgi:excisionase family DNA binding protein